MSTKISESFKLAIVGLPRFALVFEYHQWGVFFLYLVPGRYSAAYVSNLRWQVRRYHVYRAVPMRSDVRMFFISASCNRMAKHWFRSISNFLFFPLRIFERNFHFTSSFPTQSCNAGACLLSCCFRWGTTLWRRRYVIMRSSVGDVCLTKRELRVVSYKFNTVGLVAQSV